MTGSVDIDVVIGLVFIYLLYSLLVSILAEIISTNLGLRARNLNSAITRLFTDENVNVLKSFFAQSSNEVIKSFYEHPRIKFLAASWLFKKPSAIDTDTFVKTMVDIAKDNTIKGSAIAKISSGIDQLNVDSTTKNLIGSFWEEANGDMEKFEKTLGNWFDQMMEQSIEWYKRNLQILLFLIGFIVAWVFNVDTFGIVNKLSVDKKARAQMVSLATSYLENNPEVIVYSSDSTPNSIGKSISDEEYKNKLETLFNEKTKLEEEMAESQLIIGGGNWLPDSLILKKGKNGSPMYPSYIVVNKLPRKAIMGQLFVKFNCCDKLLYLLGMLLERFWGYVVTAIALSLGAPFWFDLLNKLVQLRGALSKKK